MFFWKSEETSPIIINLSLRKCLVPVAIPLIVARAINTNVFKTILRPMLHQC